MTDEPADNIATASPEPLCSVHSSTFPELLQYLGVSLAVTTYQAGKLVLLRADQGVLNTHFRSFRRPMGFAATKGRMAVGTATEIWDFHNSRSVAAHLEPKGQHDACYLPRSALFTGDILVHEMAWSGPTLWVVNTRFSCLCTLDGLHSFVPQWRPPFITALAAEDRCHLNGLAMREGRPAYVTALGLTDAARGCARTSATEACCYRYPTEKPWRLACRCPTRPAGTTANCGYSNRAAAALARSICPPANTSRW